MADKVQKRGLGAGLGALFGTEISAGEQKNISTLPISKVEPRADQPRRDFDGEKLAELADSIREHGIIQPITVRKLDSGYYQIIAGERRWRAARLAELAEVPVRIVEADDKKAAEIALVENLQRQDLNPIEEALGLKALVDDFGMTQEDAAQSVGKSRPAVTNALRLLTLSSEVLELVKNGQLSTGHARTLLSIKEPRQQLNAAKKILALSLSVRQTETMAAKLLKENPEPKSTARGADGVDYAAELEKDLQRVLGRRVRFVEGRKKGRIELEFYGAADRETLINNLYKIGTLGRKPL